MNDSNEPKSEPSKENIWPNPVQQNSDAQWIKEEKPLL